MKTMTPFQVVRRASPLLIAGVCLIAASLSATEVKVRLSFKFILNSSGSRPATGNFNTDQEIIDQVAFGDNLYRDFISEFRHLRYEIVNVSGQSAYYLNGATSADRDEIRNLALANKTAWSWRDNAINVYITGASATAISKFPPDNDIIIMCQSVYDTTLAHEVGHSLNLLHTHEGGGADGCSDTLPDDDNWTNRDQMAQNSYGLNYSQLNSSQKAAVDRTWNNLMSYHEPNNRAYLTGCQMDRESDQGYTDRTWLLTRIPTYIEVGAPTYPFPIDMGSWAFPYPTIQAAINAGETASRVLVLMAGTHADPTSVITTDTDIVTRRGVSYCREVEPEYALPYNVEDSTNPAVRSAVVRAQQLDMQGDGTNALAALVEAAQAARGRERDALQLEIGQRLQAMEHFVEAETYFTRLATEADQPALRATGLKKAEKMKAKEQERIKKQQAKQGDTPEAEEEQQ